LLEKIVNQYGSEDILSKKKHKYPCAYLATKPDCKQLMKVQKQQCKNNKIQTNNVHGRGIMIGINAALKSIISLHDGQDKYSGDVVPFRATCISMFVKQR